jgi:DNA-binding NtrC family response regulator
MDVEILHEDAPTSAREPRPLVAVVDDDRITRAVLRAHLEASGFQVEEVQDGRSLVTRGALPHAAVCLDLKLGDMPGADVLQHLKASNPELPVIVVTADDNLATVVEVMRAGAFDYVTKPVVPERLRLAIAHGIERMDLQRRLSLLRKELEDAALARKILGSSAPMERLFADIKRVTMSDIAVCVFGESGTGKELVARALHDASRRTRGPFVALNCAAIPEHLQESELFGHEKGAFTGATSTRRGRFEEAEGGTLFLDELGDMSPATQVKLLRALQERVVRRVGSSHDIQVNVRVITATHRDLESMVRAGRFRQDLYFRLMVYPIEVPPLRSRRDDIPLLVAHFLKRHREDVGRDVCRVSTEAMEALLAHDWPGNVRELENLIHRSMLTALGDQITIADLPATLRYPRLPNVPSGGAVAAPSLATLNLRELETHAIRSALEQTGGRITQAAKLLGIGRATLYRRLVETGQQPSESS